MLANAKTFDESYTQLSYTSSSSNSVCKKQSTKAQQMMTVEKARSRRSKTYAADLDLLSDLFDAGINNPHPEPELKNTI